MSDLGAKLCDYFAYRADLLDNFVQPLLMDAARAEQVYNEMKAKLKPKLVVTMNKQRGERPRSPGVALDVDIRGERE